MKALIIDDEPDAITSLRIMLQKFCTGIEVSGEALSVKEGLQLVKKIQPDILFLDVEMKGETGFDLLEQAGAENLMVVFTTAHDQYAIRALKKGATDYLLKPVDPDELVQAVEKVRKELKKQKPAAEGMLYINTGSTIEMLKKEEVMYLVADGRYSELFCTDNRRLVVCRNIGEYEEELSASGFFRIHKSVLVNMQFVLRLKKNNDDHVEMKNGVLLPISRRKKSELLTYLGKGG